MLFRDINIRKDISLCMVNLGSFGVHCQFYGANEILIFSSSLFADAMAMKAQNCQKTSEVLNILKQMQKIDTVGEWLLRRKWEITFNNVKLVDFLWKPIVIQFDICEYQFKKMDSFTQEPPTRIDKIVF